MGSDSFFCSAIGVVSTDGVITNVGLLAKVDEGGALDATSTGLESAESLAAVVTGAAEGGASPRRRGRGSSR